MIQERFNQLQPYLKGVKLVSEYTMLECILKNTWKLTNSGLLPEDVVYKAGKESEEHKGYNNYIFYSENRSIDDLIDVLEHVVRSNIEIEMKQELLRSKVEELKKIFQDKTLDELKSLKFQSELDVMLDAPKAEPKTEEKFKSNGTTQEVQ